MKKLFEMFFRTAPGFTIAGVWNSPAPQTTEEVESMVGAIAPQLMKHLATERDIYWFVVEEYERIERRGGVLPTLIKHFPLHEIEYRGRADLSDAGTPNPGVVYLNQQLSPVLTAQYGEITSNQIRCGVYVKFRDLYADVIDPLRVKNAHASRNLCLAVRDMVRAGLWGDVIDAVEEYV